MFRRTVYSVWLCLCSLGLMSVPAASFADNTQMNQTLVQIVAQLNAVLPLIDTAQRQQDKNTAVQFHFDSWTDANGVLHQGLRQDIMAIRQGIIDQINQAPLEPRTVQPLNRDFMDSTP